MAREKSLDELLKEYEAKTTWSPESLDPQAPVSPTTTTKEATEARLPTLKDVSPEAVLAVWDAIANLDPLSAFDEYGAVKSLEDMPLETRVCIKSIKVKEVFEDKIKVGEIKDVTFWDKMAANESLGKFKKMLNDQPPAPINNILIVQGLKQGLQRLQDCGSQDAASSMNNRDSIDVAHSPEGDEGKE